jgi:hypothetical protein
VVIGRAEWTAAVVDGCVEHGVSLISHKGPQLDVPRLDPAYQTSLLLEELGRTPPVPATIDAFQLYFLSRLDIVPRISSPLLDDLPLDCVTQICHAAGLDLLRHRGDTGKPTDKQRRAAGFEFLGHGLEQFERVLLDMRVGMRISQRAKTILPRLQEALARRMFDQTWKRFIDCLVDIMFRNLPYARGDMLLGRTSPARYVHDFTSAQKTYDISSHHLRAFLAGSPELAAQPFGKPQDALIRIDAADRLLLGKAPFLSAMDVSRKLGRHPRLATADLAAFSEAGIRLHEEGSISRSELPVYSEAAVDRAISALMARCEIIAKERPELFSPSRISIKLGIPSSQVWKLIAGDEAGQLFLIKGSAPLSGLRLSLGAVVEAISGLTSSTTYIQAAATLKSSCAQIYVLVATGYLATAKLRDGYTTRYALLDPKSVERFKTNYMSAREALQLLAPNGNLRTLRSLGLDPAIHVPKGIMGVNYATFFFREDVMRKLA